MSHASSQLEGAGPLPTAAQGSLESPSPARSSGRRRRHGAVRMAALVSVLVVFVGLDFFDLAWRDKQSLDSSRHSKAVGERAFDSATSGKAAESDSAHSNLVLNSDSNQIGDVKEGNSTTPRREGEESSGFAENGGTGLHFWRGAPWRQEVGEWFSECGGTSAPIRVLEVVEDKECPRSCSGNGVCNHELGECRCSHGYKGSDCAELDDYPCNEDVTNEWPAGPPRSSTCAAVCNRRTAQCFCGPDSPYPNRPAVEPCGFVTREGVLHHSILDNGLLYSKDSERPGWCMVDPTGSEEPLMQCYCNYDGQTGRFCQIPTRAYCLGGCNNHGDCRTGHCECRDGWFGIDCSIPSHTSNLENWTPPWLKLVATPDTPLATSRMQASEDLASKQAGLMVTRRRPLVYIYDLPGEFNFHHLQGRKWRPYCVPWWYNEENATEFNYGDLYGMETEVLEGLLASPHRTTNAEEADFFYVPVFVACMIHRADDSPRMDTQKLYKDTRPYIATAYVIKAYDYIRSTYPYWDRTGGRDHIWNFPWDEGACSAPQVIWNSIMLSPWGNTMTKHKRSTTTYGIDIWNQIPDEVRGDHPCFDAAKDIVLPAAKKPDVELVNSQLWARPIEERSIFFYFRGNLGFRYQFGRPEANYSMGIRQEVAKFFGSTLDKNNQTGELYEESVIVAHTHEGDYGQQLSRSRFCGVFPGDGFSARMEDSILHGCIPVIIQDGIQMAYENMMDYKEFSIRISEDQIPQMIHILKAIPEDRVRKMQVAIRALWQRWSYHSVVETEAQRQKEWHGFEADWAQANRLLQEDDVIATLIQILHYKLHNDPWRGEPDVAGHHAAREYGIPQKCVRSRAGRPPMT